MKKKKEKRKGKERNTKGVQYGLAGVVASIVYSSKDAWRPGKVLTPVT
jgi:hypothetical protein